MKNNISRNMGTYGVGAAILIAALIFVAYRAPTEVETNTPAAVQVASALSVSNPSYAFGDIDIFGGKVATEFPITNTGSEPVAILDGTTSCACTDGEIGGVVFGMHEGMPETVTIAPAETKTLSAVYDPLFHGPGGVGKVTRELLLRTNSSETPEIRVRFTANVVK